MKLIWSYLKSKHRWLLLDCFGGFLFVVVNLGMPTILARMIDEGITQNSPERLTFWAIMMFVIVVLGIAGRISLVYASGKLTTSMIKELRTDIYAKLQTYSHHEYEQTS